MNRFASILVLLAGLLGAGATHAETPADATDAAPADPSVSAVLDAVQRRYADAASVHARFHQTATNLALAESTEADGECWFAKPGKMRWVYESPEPQTLVSDGTTLWFYQPTRYQVMVSSIPPELAARIPTAFFSGTGDLSENYTATAVEPEASDAPSGGQVIDLEPRAEGSPAPFRKLRITVEPERGLVTTIEIHDLFGNVNRLDFSEIELLEQVDDALFTFEVPEGTHVVRP